ncbi:MAG: hypothetical protein WBA20_01130 [Ketobacter sp.]|nr:MAG: hypothetical protein D6160_18515 [Ketobacter sp.]
MPNTLAHIGVQTVLTRSVLKDADVKWIYLGCVIPDLPWIIKRFILLAHPAIEQLWLQAYLLLQATLLFSLLASASFACLAARKLQTFAILASCSLVHLLLDATQTKWGNGADLFIPFNWHMLNFGWYWPEHWFSYALTVWGLIIMLFYWRESTSRPPDLVFNAKSTLACLILLAVYFLLPLALIEQVRQHDSHYNATLHSHDRKGKTIAFDRKTVKPDEHGGWLVDLYGEWIPLDGVEGRDLQIVSIKGHFSEHSRIAVSDYRVHPGLLRNYLSMVGLFLVALVWVWSIVRPRLIKRSG